MNAIGPDCSFAESFSFFLRDARDVSLELEFENPNSKLGKSFGNHDLTSARFAQIKNEPSWKMKLIDEEMYNGAELSITC